MQNQLRWFSLRYLIRISWSVYFYVKYFCFFFWKMCQINFLRNQLNFIPLIMQAWINPSVEIFIWMLHIKLVNLITAQPILFLSVFHITHCVQICFSVSLYCIVKLLPTQNWMRHCFHQNFLTNSLNLSNLVLFASEDCNLTSFWRFPWFLAEILIFYKMQWNVC